MSYFRSLFWMAPAVLLIGLAGGAVYWRSTRVTDETVFESGLSAVMSGDLKRASDDLAALTARDGSVPHRRLLEGGILLRRGNLREALRYLSAVEPAQELRTPSQLLLGECYYKLHRHAEAEMCFLQVVADDPDQIDARRWLGAIYYDLGTIQAAANQMAHVVRLDPSDYRPHHLLGVIYFDIDKFTPAADQFRTALQLDPPRPIAEQLHLELARALVRNRDYQGALESLAQAPGLSDEAAAMAVRAQCAHGLGEPARAQQLVATILAANPDDRDALLLQARIEQEQGHWPQSIRPLQQILEADPHDDEARYLLALAYARSGDEERARQQMQLSEESQHLKSRASDLYAKADQNPTDPEVREQLADICDELGKPQLAAMWRRAADALKVRKAMHVGAPTTGDAAAPSAARKD